MLIPLICQQIKNLREEDGEKAKNTRFKHVYWKQILKRDPSNHHPHHKHRSKLPQNEKVVKETTITERNPKRLPGSKDQNFTALLWPKDGKKKEFL